MATRELQAAKDELEKVQADLAKARKLLLADAIEASDYREIKADFDDKIARIECRISELSKTCSAHGLRSLLDMALGSVSNLEEMYIKGDVYSKRQIITIIFPENIEFDGAHFRTARLNEVIAGVLSVGAGFKEKKGVQNGEKTASCPLKRFGADYLR